MYVDDSLLCLEVPLLHCCESCLHSLSRRTTGTLECANKYNYRPEIKIEILTSAPARDCVWCVREACVRRSSETRLFVHLTLSNRSFVAVVVKPIACLVRSLSKSIFLLTPKNEKKTKCRTAAQHQART